MKHQYIVITALALCMGYGSASAQLMNKLKQKAGEAVEKAVLGDKTDSSDNSNSGNQNNNGNSNSNNSGNQSNSGSAQNKKGGLVSAPPDVKQNLADAETAFKGGTYGESRYAVQQAMLGVEMEIGQKILKSLPETIADIKFDPTQDQVTSTGWGWSGLTIARKYPEQGEKEDLKEFRLTVANNAVWMNSVNMYLNNPGYSQSTGGEQNWKQVKVKGYRAVIEFDEYSGYKLSIPLGQSSLIVCEGVNFDDEKAMMTAANAVDIDGIKKQLGEQ